MDDHRLVPLVQGRHAGKNMLGRWNEPENEPVGAGFRIDLVEVNASSAGFRLQWQRPLLHIDTRTIAVHHGSGLVKRHRLDGHRRGHTQFEALCAHDRVVGVVELAGSQIAGEGDRLTLSSRQGAAVRSRCAAHRLQVADGPCLA